MIRLAHFFNKTILVCIPSLFEDQQLRPFKLVGIEEAGLWLESEELAKILQPPEGTKSLQRVAAVFFPFSHIAYATAEAPPLAFALPLAPPAEHKEPRPVEHKEQRHVHTNPAPKTEPRHATSGMHKKRKK